MNIAREGGKYRIEAEALRLFGQLNPGAERETRQRLHALYLLRPDLAQ